MSGSSHTNLAFLSTLVNSWDENTEVEPDSSHTPCTGKLDMKEWKSPLDEETPYNSQ